MSTIARRTSDWPRNRMRARAEDDRAGIATDVEDVTTRRASTARV
jgi:hypothetical protein